ncbi:MAG TPA: hypothetical protein VG871_16480 [Vicinamibacterales bacterium]|nr:hypothetical protein [Vicinamibacterales bacterium]
MRRVALVVGVFAAMVGAPAIGFGQWFHQRTPGIPRTPDGKPNLTAPVPKAEDGHPDLSGLWHAAQRRHCTDSKGETIPCGIEIGGSPTAGNLGRDLPGGMLPYKPEAAKLMQERHAVLSVDDPHVRCLPDNPPRAWTLPHMTKIIQSKYQLALMYEVNAMYRQIFTDGRSFPDDPTPAWNGYSVGHWEGDTLVVETRGFRDNLWADTWGSPMSDATKMTEKFHRLTFGTIDIVLTIDDPKNYTKAFTVMLHEELEPDTELVDEFCLEGEKDYERLQRSRTK